MVSKPGAFEGWGGGTLGRTDRGQCGWTEEQARWAAGRTKGLRSG